MERLKDLYELYLKQAEANRQALDWLTGGYWTPVSQGLEAVGNLPGVGMAIPAPPVQNTVQALMESPLYFTLSPQQRLELVRRLTSGGEIAKPIRFREMVIDWLRTGRMGE